jgi:hypothetical protein
VSRRLQFSGFNRPHTSNTEGKVGEVEEVAKEGNLQKKGSRIVSPSMTDRSI